MDIFNSTFNGSYNEAFSIADSPIIRFPDQTDYLHRQVVFLKCFMISVMENKEMGRKLIQRLQFHLTVCYVALAGVMMALSSELVWKAIPLVLFCYSCQTLKFFTIESNLRRCLSFMFHVLCCFEVSGFEFIFDVYFILCFLAMALYSMYLKKDHMENDRGALQRASVILVFCIEIALMRYSYVIDYKYTLFVNAALTLKEAAMDNFREKYVAVLYNTMAQFLLVSHMFAYDVDARFGEFMHFVWDYMIYSLGIF